MNKKILFLLIKISLLILIFSVLSANIYSIPAFARKYKTSCTTCHYDYPTLNAFGKAFFNNGFRWPGGDSNYIKEKPVSLGSDANKKVFPDAIWPDDIPGTAPLSIYLSGQIKYDATSEIKWGFEIPNYLNVLYGGTLGNQFSFLGETELSYNNNKTNFNFSAFIQWDQSPGFHIKAGEVRADPTPRNLRLTTNNYNVESMTSRNGWSFADAVFGLELWGALNGPGNRGGFTYRFGIVNGQGLISTKPQKDFTGMITYKIGGLSETGETKGVKNLQFKPYIDNSLLLGGYFYKGTEAKDSLPDENLTVFGGNTELWYDRFIINVNIMQMISDIASNERKSIAYYVQGSGLIYPWLISLIRYEWTKTDINDNNVKPVSSIIPGLSILLRPNLKVNIEAKKYLDKLNTKNTTFNLKISVGI